MDQPRPAVLIDDIKARLTRAIRDRDRVARDILGLALGEVQTAEARANRALRDDEAAAILRRLVKSNEETLSLASDASLSPASGASSASAEDEVRVSALRREIELLAALLPAALSPDAIEQALAAVAPGVRSASSEGQAMGIAMKHLKATGASVDAASVGQAIKKLRG